MGISGISQTYILFISVKELQNLFWKILGKKCVLLFIMHRSTHASVPGVNWSSPYQLLRTIDSTGDVVGSGCNHQVSLQHLEQRCAMFEQLHQQHLDYLPKDTQPKQVWVIFIKLKSFIHPLHFVFCVFAATFHKPKINKKLDTMLCLGSTWCLSVVSEAVF